jgi:hypothetical protein
MEQKSFSTLGLVLVAVHGDVIAGYDRNYFTSHADFQGYTNPDPLYGTILLVFFFLDVV